MVPLKFSPASAVIPAQAGIQGALAGCWPRSGFPRFALPNALSCHSRLPRAGGNVLSKPLDSGLRRNDK